MSQQQGSYVTAMDFHEYADLFPMMSAEEFKALVQDMLANGFDPTSPIVTFQNKILDGRNRFKAAIEAKVKPIFDVFKGSDPLGFVVRHNLHRRHLNDSQRTAIAAKLANLERGGDRPSENDKNFDVENFPNRNGVSQKQAAELMNVSDRNLRTFNAVAERMPELVPIDELKRIGALVSEWKQERVK